MVYSPIKTYDEKKTTVLSLLNNGNRMIIYGSGGNGKSHICQENNISTKIVSGETDDEWIKEINDHISNGIRVFESNMEPSFNVLLKTGTLPVYFTGQYSSAVNDYV